jgi:16S rRNA (guanine527-N7)-methyltransferase
MFHVKHHLNLNDLGNFLIGQGIDFTGAQLHQFELYINLIKNWSSRSNLISRHDFDDIVEKHILPSALFTQFIQPVNEDRILDIGSGAGFPGVVLKILQPNINITLIDSTRKKYLFLMEVNEVLELNCKVLNCRVETLKKEIALKYDIILCRAVADLEILWNWSADILKDNGFLYTIKGERDDEEIIRLMSRGIKTYILKPNIRWIEFSKHLENKIIVKVEK